MEVLMMWKETEKEAELFCAQDKTAQRMTGLTHRIASFVDVLDVRFPDTTIEFEETDRLCFYNTAKLAFWYDPDTDVEMSPKCAKTTLRLYTQGRITQHKDWEAVRAKR
jgi:hypothetical protein